MPSRRKSPLLAILVVDDEPTVRDALINLLTDDGHRVVGAENGSAALAELEVQPFDLVISDIFMPGRDGLELVPVIRTQYPGTKIITISGGSTVLSATDCSRISQALGASASLEKPFDLATLTATIAMVIT